MDIYKVKWTVLVQNVFSLLCQRSGEKMSQRKIAKELDISPTAAGTAVKALEKIGLAKKEKTKTINFISLNREEATALKRVENLKSIYVSGLATHLEETLPGSTIILFGSYARGEDTTRSDIDIVVIGRGEKAVKVEPYEKSLRRRINMNFYRTWKEMSKELRNNILNGIILHGSVDL